MAAILAGMSGAINVIRLCILVATVKLLNGNPVLKLDHHNAKWIHLSGGEPYRWKTTAAPAPRSRSASWADLAGNLWLFGGLGEDTKNKANAHLTNDLWFFNNTDMTWKEVKKPSLNQKSNKWSTSIPPVRKGAVGCGIPGLAFVIFGGEGVQSRTFEDTWIYDVDENKWTSLYHTDVKNQTHPPGREDPAVWCLFDKMIIFGGKSKEHGIRSDLWILSLRDLTWENIPTPQSDQMFPGPHAGSVTWATGEHTLYMFGGAVENETQSYIADDLWKYSLVSQTWTRLAAAEDRSPWPAPRKNAQGWHMAGEDKLVLFGGEGYRIITESRTEPTLFDDLWIYDAPLNLWEKIQFYIASMGQSNKYNNYTTSAQSQGMAWSSRNNIFYTFGGLGFNHDISLSIGLQDHFWMLLPPNTQIPDKIDIAALTLIVSPVSRLSQPSLSDSPTFIFLMSLITFGGLVMLVGAAFCLKKMTDYPRHNPGKEYKVKYSKLGKTDDILEEESREFLIRNDDDENRASFRIKK